MTTMIDALPDALQGVAKTFTITYPAPVETLDATPPDLPTTLPGSPQFSLTLAAGDLPTIAPAPMNTPKYHALLYLGGLNTSAFGRTISFEVYKNAVLVDAPTGTPPAGYYWTLNAFIPDVADGDTLEVFAYASDVDVEWDYQAYAIVVDEVQLAPPDRILARLTYTMAAHPVLASGTPVVQDEGAFRLQHLGIMEAEIAGTTTIESQVQRSSVYAGWCFYGHLMSTADVLVSATDRPLYRRNIAPSDIAFILTDVTV